MSASEAINPEVMPDESPLTIIQQQEHVLLDVQVSTAKAYPRSVQTFQADLEAWATLNEEVAIECFFSLPVGGTKIIGPSIRFAELVTAAYRNLTVDSKVIGEEEGNVVVEGTCRDLERNTAFRSQVRRPIRDKGGKRYKQSVVETTINAGMAIARRNAIFQVVPKALWIPIWNKARAVAIGGAETFDARRQATVARLRELGADMANVKHFLGDKEPKDMDADSLLRLVMRLRDIESGSVTAQDAFPAPKKEVSKRSASSASAALDKASATLDAAEDIAKGREPEIDTATGEVIPDEVGGGFELSTDGAAEQAS